MADKEHGETGGSGIVDRRTFIGAVSTGVTVGLAGCSGGGGGGDGDGGSGDDGGDGGSGDDGGSEDTATETAGGGDGAGIKIGVLVPFTGEFSWVGANVMPVAEMVAQVINDEGGIDGNEVSLVQGDTEATVDASVSAIRSLIDVEDVDGIIGPTSLTFTGVIDIIQNNEVPVVSPTAGTTELNDTGGEFIFRTVPSDSLGGRAIALAAREEQFNGTQSYERMGLLVGEAPALQSFKAPIRDAFEEFGGTVTKVQDFSTGKSSYNAEVSSMMDSDPEIIALIASPEDGRKIIRAGFNAGYEGNWFLTQESANQAFLDDTKNQLTEGIFGLQEASNPEAVEAGRVEAFTQDVEEFSGEPPKLFATNTYDAMNVMASAMVATASAGSDMSGPNIAGNIPAVANPPGNTVMTFPEASGELTGGNEVDYSGLVGPVNFDEDGDITSPFEILRAEGGEWTQASILPAEEL